MQPGVVIVGFGSIGRRYFSVLQKLGYRVAIVSRRHNLNIPHTPLFLSIQAALSNFQTEHIILCTETSHHEEDLRVILSLNFRGKVLIEKPIGFGSFVAPVPEVSDRWFVGYNMRFLPIIVKAKEILAKEKIFAAEIRACSYLPDWRPDRDYRLTYSAHRAAGGGVLHDLSHELDYLTWLFGSWVKVTAAGGKLSRLDMDADDHYCILFQLQTGAIAQVTLSFLERPEERRIVCQTEQGTYRFDLMTHEIFLNGDRIWQGDAKEDNDLSYFHQVRAFMENEHSPICTYDQGIGVMKTIHAVEKANSHAWMTQ